MKQPRILEIVLKGEAPRTQTAGTALRAVSKDI
jgi:hypothetical protein